MPSGSASATTFDSPREWDLGERISAVDEKPPLRDQHGGDALQRQVATRWMSTVQHTDPYGERQFVRLLVRFERELLGRNGSCAQTP